MKNKFRNTLMAALFLGGAGLVAAEVVEEETWYNAGGEVVKKVTRTYSGADADRTPDWEPAWVIRERQQPSRVIRYSSGRSSWGSRSYAPYYYGTAWYGGCYSAAPRRGGFSGCYRSGGGGSGWGVSYRAPGITLQYRD
jgi:regulation of enolase protein 1 (concanavalin A-like superfamily)